MPEKIRVREFAGGEVSFWIADQSAIHLKAITSFGDPVELIAEEAEELANALLEAARELELPKSCGPSDG